MKEKEREEMEERGGERGGGRKEKGKGGNDAKQGRKARRW